MAINVTTYPKFKNEPFEKMFRRFRNQVDRAGILKDLKRKEFYEKPSVGRHRKDQEMARTRLIERRRERAAEQRASMLRSVKR